MTMLMPHKLAQKVDVGSSSNVTSLLAILAERREPLILRPAMDEELKTALQILFSAFLITIWPMSSWPIASTRFEPPRNEAILLTSFGRSAQRFIGFSCAWSSWKPLLLSTLSIISWSQLRPLEVWTMWSRIMLPYRSFMRKVRSIHPVWQSFAFWICRSLSWSRPGSYGIGEVSPRSFCLNLQALWWGSTHRQPVLLQHFAEILVWTWLRFTGLSMIGNIFILMEKPLG